MIGTSEQGAAAPEVFDGKMRLALEVNGATAFESHRTIDGRKMRALNHAAPHEPDPIDYLDEIAGDLASEFFHGGANGADWREPARRVLDGVGIRASFSFYDGALIDLLDPDPELITPERIAHGLAATCRYAGHIPPGPDGRLRWYSVAEHSILVAAHSPFELTLPALLHDASEGLGLCDIPGPLKKVLPHYQRIERGMQRAVALRFGLDPAVFEHKAIKLADRRLLASEQIAIRGRTPKYWIREERDAEHVPFPDVEFRLWDPTEAFNAYACALADAVATAPKSGAGR